MSGLSLLTDSLCIFLPRPFGDGALKFGLLPPLKLAPCGRSPPADGGDGFLPPGTISLMTAFLLNMFLFRGSELVPADELRTMLAESRHKDLLKCLKNIYLETERLSPPIIGIMRRSTREVLLRSHDQGPDTILPAGWDIWSYFVGAGRDLTIFGADCNLFNPSRYGDDSVPEPIGFGAGPKSCLGKDLVRQIVIHVGEHLLLKGIDMNGIISAPGLKAWLGWDEASPEEWAAEMKQLPTQRPKNPVMVEFVKYIRNSSGFANHLSH